MATLDGMDLNAFAPATVMLQALSQHHVSAIELLDLHRQQIERFNPALNAIILPDCDRARAAAREADVARERGDQRSLLGLPVTIKDSIDVAGLQTICGVEARSGIAPAEADAPAVSRLRRAGAIVMGKTNTARRTADWQTNNPVFGRTNNPWDLSRTPGGSSGGAAAAVAAGLSPLDIGSDIGGSIRIPAAFCGIFGHRPSESAVPPSGHYPGWSLPNAAMFMNVLGPLARSAEDLDLALEIMAGPDVGEDAAWRLQFPPPRHLRLREFRVAVLPELDWYPVSGEIRAAVDRAVEVLLHAGAHVEQAQPESFGDWREHSLLFHAALSLMYNRERPREERIQRASRVRSRSEDPFDLAYAHGLEVGAAEYLDWHRRREEYRAAYRRFFRDWDIFLTPITLGPAYPHIDTPERGRTIDVDGRPVRYDLQAIYAGMATFSGQPATAFPVLPSREGLPIGLQAIGPYLDDRTSIHFAGLLSEELGGFQPPPTP